MSYTRAQWAGDFLRAIGNSNPNPLVVNWVVGWSRFETGAGAGAAYNLLNTTQRETGSTDFNNVGVQNFTSYTQGIDANAQVLQNGYYPELYQALATNNINALMNPNTSIQAELNTWGTGWKNWGVTGQGGGDTFSGTPATISGSSNPGLTTLKSNAPLIGPLIDWLNNFVGQAAGLLSWVTNPIRIIKLVVGVGLLLLSMLVFVWPRIGEQVAGVYKKAMPIISGGAIRP